MPVDDVYEPSETIVELEVLESEESPSGVEPVLESTVVEEAESLAAQLAEVLPVRAPVSSDEASAASGELEELRAKADELSRALALRDEALAARERSYRAAIVDRELLAAMAGRPLVESATQQLLKLWRDEVETYQEGGELKVRSRGGQKVQEAVADWLDRPEYAHFSRPSSRGGTARPGHQSQVHGEASAVSARNLGESVIQQWLQAEAGAASDGSLPVGLHRRRR